MTLPQHVNTRWITQLGDDQLLAAEAELHSVFQKEEKAERTRSGARYVLLQGPPALVNAWLRWLLVSNATRTRGLLARHGAKVT